MSENNKIFSRKELITVGIIFIAILIIGIILLILNLNESFYSSSSTVRSIFKAITYLGEPIVFIVMVAIFYIVYDKRFAKNLTLSLLFSIYLNEIVKDIRADQRPETNKDPDEITPENPLGLIETSYGFPSNHTQNAVATWGYIAYKFKEKLYFVIIMGVIIFLVAISRMIIGPHDLEDVIGGALIGLGFLLFFVYLEPYGSKQFNKLSLTIKIVVSIIISLILFLSGIFLFPTSGTDLLPSPSPFTDTGGFALVGGVLLGLGIGYTLENEYIKYEPKDINLKWKILNLIIGLVILFVAYFALEAIKDVFDSVFYRYIRYALIALILTYLLPFIFVKINKKK
jgi:membrane-associated phospholipid phosphatase